MKKKICFAILFAFTLISHFQEKTGNSIFYADLMLGGSSISGGSFNSSFTLNYQNKNNLFSFRRSLSKKIDDDGGIVFWALPISVLDTKLGSSENSFLYGKRFVKNEFSYAFSTGISFLKHNELNVLLDDIINQDNFIGLPIEISLSWFKKDKEKIKLFGLFPLGKETGFGMSSGLKFYGTISKKSYFGAGLVIGFGYYKNYN